MNKEKNICVFGASSNKIDDIFKTEAFAVGRCIALSGCGLVFGAGDSGLMGQAARGAFSAGGRIIGVIPEKLNKKGYYTAHCIDDDACIACAMCAMMCPDGIINVYVEE